MKRFNYLARDRRRRFAVGSLTLAIDNRIRGPLSALVATAVLTTIVCVLQLLRLQSAHQVYATASSRLLAAHLPLEALARLQARVDGKARLFNHVGDVRRTSLQRANELARIGNRLPPDTWLHALRFQDGSYSLEGTSDRVAAVGSAILALRDTNRAPAPRLVSLRDDARAGHAHVRYTLRLDVNP